MNKIGLLLFICQVIICQSVIIGFTQQAQAQTTPPELIQDTQPNYLGVKLQGVYSSISTEEKDDIEALKYRPTYGLGLQAFIGIDERYNAQIEFLYIKRGFQLDFSEVDARLDATSLINLSYLQMPILGSLHLPMGPISLKFMVGPYLSYLLSSKHEINGQLGGKEVSQTTTIDNISRIDFGIIAAPGFNITVDQLMFNVDLRLDYGFRRFSEDANTKDEIRNLAFSLNAGVMMAF